MCTYAPGSTQAHTMRFQSNSVNYRYFQTKKKVSEGLLMPAVVRLISLRAEVDLRSLHVACKPILHDAV